MFLKKGGGKMDWLELLDFHQKSPKEAYYIHFLDSHVKEGSFF